MLIQVNKNPSLKDLRQFGWTLIIGFGLLGSLLFWRGRLDAAIVICGIGIPLGILSLMSVRAAKSLYKVWMGWAYVMGTITTRVILTLLFFGVITPVAILFRCIRRDPLRLKKDSHMKTYWSDHPKIMDRSYYQRLF